MPQDLLDRKAILCMHLETFRGRCCRLDPCREFLERSSPPLTPVSFDSALEDRLKDALRIKDHIDGYHEAALDFLGHA